LASSSVTAKIVDQNGAPVVGQPALICGLNVCSDRGMTKADGTISISTNLSEKRPAFKVGDALNYAEIAIQLTTTTTDLTAGGTAVITTANFQGVAGQALNPGNSATSGDVTVAVPANATVSFDLIHGTPDQQLFRSVNIPMANEGPWLASSGKTEFKLLYGVAVAETSICPAAKVTVNLPHATTMPNDFGWAPGAAVEFWIMTTSAGQEYAPNGGWAVMSDGTVSADGKSVSTVDGQGFVLLENFAIRLKM
jgi:hypothetical protein